jgi:hypothetical protein
MPGHEMIRRESGIPDQPGTFIYSATLTRPALPSRYRLA